MWTFYPGLEETDELPSPTGVTRDLREGVISRTTDTDTTKDKGSLKQGTK